MADAEPDNLIERCRGGDDRAWRTLVDRYAGMVMAVGRACGLTTEASEDLAQSVFATLSRRINAIESDRAVGAWLKTTAAREAWRLAKRDRRGRAGETLRDEGEPGSETDAAEAVGRIELHQRLRAALEELGGRCRDLLRALYFGSEAGAYDRAAADLGMPHGSIGPTRRRCLEKLGVLMRDSAPTGSDPASE